MREAGQRDHARKGFATPTDVNQLQPCVGQDLRQRPIGFGCRRLLQRGHRVSLMFETVVTKAAPRPVLR